MKTKKLTTIRQVLTRMKYIVNAEPREHYFLCSIPDYLLKNSLITKELRDSVLSHLKKERPTSIINKEFYNFPSYNKEQELNVWWSSYTSLGYREQYKINVKEKIRFLKHIITKLDKQKLKHLNL